MRGMERKILHVHVSNILIVTAGPAVFISTVIQQDR